MKTLITDTNARRARTGSSVALRRAEDGSLPSAIRSASTILAFAMLLAASASGQAPIPPADQIDATVQLLQSARPVAPAAGAPAAAARAESAQFTLSIEGYVHSISAGPGAEFPVLGAVAGQSEATVDLFIQQNGLLFGIASPAVDFTLRKMNSTADRDYLRMTQTYAGIPVFGGEMVVQVNSAGGVEFASGNFDRNTSDLDQGRLSIDPTLSSDMAIAAARDHYARSARGQALDVTTPELTLFVPSLLKLAGPKRLTWKMEVTSDDRFTVAYEVFIDAHTGVYVQDIPLNHEALSRLIYDCNSTASGSLVRSEGQAACGIADADNAYDQLGDVYNFYYDQFARDGVADTGAALLAYVRYCPAPDDCPYTNAFWSSGSQAMVFGAGYTIDDATGHEMTHGVTDNESDLIYLNESGAINESLSDVFGEYVDLTNGRGNDASGVRWQIGEELPGGYIRSMSNPPLKNDPDWLGSNLYVPPVASGDPNNDYGGVHTNSGVNNKLCFLLTDGDPSGFRGFGGYGMGIDLVAALYYEANTNLLISSSGWDDLRTALKQAAINLGWSTSQRANLLLALDAVGLEVRPGIFVDETAVCPAPLNGAFCQGFPPVGPATNLASALSLLAPYTDGTIQVRGTMHTSGVNRRISIHAYGGAPARLEP